MGYTTEFEGYIEVNSPLSEEECLYLEKFSNTRRIVRRQSAYYVGGGGLAGQAREDDIIDYNMPPEEQPGLWCQWVPNRFGNKIEWDGGEKFYNSVEWMEYIIDHFFGDDPLAKSELPFLQSHKLNGEILAQGEDIDDRWRLIVKDNVVSREEHPHIGAKIECPNCECHFYFDVKSA